MGTLVELVRSLTGTQRTSTALPVINTQSEICKFASPCVNNVYLCSNSDANRYTTMCLHVNLVEGTCSNPKGSYERRR